MFGIAFHNFPSTFHMVQVISNYRARAADGRVEFCLASLRTKCMQFTCRISATIMFWVSGMNFFCQFPILALKASYHSPTFYMVLSGFCIAIMKRAEKNNYVFPAPLSTFQPEKLEDSAETKLEGVPE